MGISSRIKRIAVFTGKGCLWGLVVLAGIIGFLFAVHWFTSKESVEFTWDTSIENLSGNSLGFYDQDRKHRGVSLMVREEITPADLDKMVRNNIEWVAVHPYALQPKGHNNPEIEFDKSGVLGWGIRDSTLVVFAELADKAGLHIFLKPHLWLRGSEESKWRSEIAMDSDSVWQEWFENYSRFILHYANMADSLGVEMFSIGTELQQAALQRESDWRQLIARVRSVYSGRLIYSANWHEEYEQIKFWDALDAIGVQAYFPLTDRKNPSVDELVEGWKIHKEQLSHVSRRFNKPVIFTEIGYKSVAGSAIKPWAWVSLINIVFDRLSVTTQMHAYSAFFDVFWDESWFEGAFIWRWTPHHDRIDMQDRSFYIQNKPAQNIVAQRYARISKTHEETSADTSTAH